MPDKTKPQKNDVDALRAKLDKLELGLKETSAAPLPEPEKPKSQIPQRLFSGIGDALQSYASIKQGGPAVQGNIERFLEKRMGERQESREEIKRQRQADIDAGTREVERASGELTFARGIAAQKDLAVADAATAATAAGLEREHDTELNEARLAADAALSQADITFRELRMRKGFEREDTAKLDAQNQAAAQGLSMMFQGDGSTYIDENGQEQEVNLKYQIAQGMTYEEYKLSVDLLMSGSGVTPLAEDALRKNADQAWKISGGALPGDPQAPVAAADDPRDGGLFGANPMIWGIGQAARGIGAYNKFVDKTRAVGDKLLGQEDPQGGGGAG